LACNRIQISHPIESDPEQQPGIIANSTPPIDDGVKALVGNFHTRRGIHLRHAEGLKELPQQHLSDMGWWALARLHQVLLGNSLKTHRAERTNPSHLDSRNARNTSAALTFV
jgi:hypothetical protein